MNKPRITCSFPDDSHETIEFHCPCGESVSYTIDLSRGGEIKTRTDKALIEAAIGWYNDRLFHKGEPGAENLLTAIRNHPDYKEGDE